MGDKKTFETSKDNIKRYCAVKSESLSTQYEPRYVVVDTQSGKILDDAQGYGYKSVQRAYAGYGYKNRDKTKDSEREKRRRAVCDFCRTHEEFILMIEQYMFEIAKGSWGPNAKIDVKLINRCFESQNLYPKDFGFTSQDFLKYWDEKPLKHKKKTRQERGI